MAILRQNIYIIYRLGSFWAIFGLFLTIFALGSQQNIWKSHFFNQLINRAPKNSVFGSNNLVKPMHLLKTNVYYLYHYIYHYIYHYLSNTFSISNLFCNIKPLRPTLCSPSQRLNDGNKANNRQLQKLIIQGNFIFLENIQYFSHFLNGVFIFHRSFSRQLFPKLNMFLLRLEKH